MKKRNIILSAILAGTALCGSSAMAKTYGYEDGGKILYISENSEGAESRSSVSNELTVEYASPESLSEEEQKKQSDWHKEEMRQFVSYLEKYGVSYDAEKDCLLYQGKTVRWLIDEQMDNTFKAVQMPEGEIDVYTVRAEDYSLNGVRIASQEEYDERTKKDAENTAAAEKMAKETIAEVIETGDAAVAEGTIEEMAEEAITYVQMGASSSWEDDAVPEDTQIEMAEGTGGFYEDTAEYKKKVQEYGENGITQGTDGDWMWNGKPVYLLMDEDGSFYQNGGEEAKDNKIYLIVKRNKDGEIDTVKEVMAEEVQKEWILRGN